ncbi:hypothetical protein PpBr36_00420 [Pyricularia pennisetigena]|uniref:hypothetical protein n=1 Tax=Pyricularia pennisetigena TaxID=1578925 RepID=UPI001154F65F|nr:hypothetical protein PpBr36_00420 [Pyricularia pennisetigena]TLS28443.1 hypothetical protein PpBr36_00420 [Pyricularia pennisetigena]
MRLYSSSVLLLGAAALQYVGLVVARGVRFDFDTGLPKTQTQNGTTNLFTYNDLKAQPEPSLQVPFSANATFRISEISLLRQSDQVSIYTGDGRNSFKDIKMDVKMGTEPIRPSTQVPAGAIVTISLQLEAVDKLLNRPTESVSLGLNQDGMKIDYPKPVILHFKLTYSPVLSLDSGIGSRQAESPADSTLPIATTKRFALTRMDKSDVNFARLVAVTEPMLRETDDTLSPGGSTGDEATETTGNPMPSQTVRPDSGSLAPTASSSPSSRKLSTAEIAGIAVGAGLGFLLIAGALAFCILRRRRRNAEATHVLGYNGGGRSGDIVAEKEAANAAVSESGAHSPYSDDGRPHFHRDGALAGAAAEASVATGTAGLMAAHHQDEQSAGADYAPYSDRPSNVSMADTAVGSASAIGTASSTPPVVQPISTAPGPAGAAMAMEGERVPVVGRSDTAMSGTYAHLVEDGMTAAEIARLEDEERQLDQAIERARGVTTK